MATSLEASIPAFSVGMIVRIPRDDSISSGTNSNKVKRMVGRATVVTMTKTIPLQPTCKQVEEFKYTLMWDDPAPNPISHAEKEGLGKNYEEGSWGCSVLFRLIPHLCDVVSSTKTLSPWWDSEVVISHDMVRPLLEFETDTNYRQLNPHVWKERGDILLKLGDPSAAIPYYDMALQQTSQVQIGSTILLLPSCKSTQKEKIHPVLIAEVDCLDDHTIDITYLQRNGTTSTEAVIPTTDVVLAISPQDYDLQIRILLNLARCLLQLAEFDSIGGRPTVYREGATISCSMALAILQLSSWEDNEGAAAAAVLDSSVASLEMTALLLRSRSYAARAQWQHAHEDVRQLLLRSKPQGHTTVVSSSPINKEIQLWKKELDVMIARSERANRKLVKSMCHWIQQTTTANAPDNLSPTLSDKPNLEQPMTKF